MTAAPGGAGERITDDALHAVRRIEAFLSRDLVRRAAAEDAAGTGVRTLGPLPYDDDVDVIRRHTGQRGLYAGIEPDRPQIDVMVKREAQLEQQPALEHAARHSRVADGTEQNRVVPTDLFEHGVGQRLLRRMPAPRAEVILRRHDLRVVRRGNGIENT